MADISAKLVKELRDRTAAGCNPVEYDPLISKLVAWGSSRVEAVERMRRALDEYYVGGIQTNLSLFRTILRYPDFLEGRLDTGLIDRLLEWEGRTEARSGALAGHLSREALELDRKRAAALAAALFASTSSRNGSGKNRFVAAPDSRWRREGRQRLLRPGPPPRGRA